MYYIVDSIFGVYFSTYARAVGNSGDSGLPIVMGGEKMVSLRSPSKPFSKHLFYVTDAKLSPERHHCIYIAQLPCYASQDASFQDRRIKIIANSSPSIGSSWVTCNRFRTFFSFIAVSSCRS